MGPVGTIIIGFIIIMALVIIWLKFTAWCLDTEDADAKIENAMCKLILLFKGE